MPCCVSSCFRFLMVSTFKLNDFGCLLTDLPQIYMHIPTELVGLVEAKPPGTTATGEWDHCRGHVVSLSKVEQHYAEVYRVGKMYKCKTWKNMISSDNKCELNMNSGPIGKVEWCGKCKAEQKTWKTWTVLFCVSSLGKFLFGTPRTLTSYVAS